MLTGQCSVVSGGQWPMFEGSAAQRIKVQWGNWWRPGPAPRGIDSWGWVVVVVVGRVQWHRVFSR